MCGRRVWAEVWGSGAKNRDADGASGAEEGRERVVPGSGGCAHTVCSADASGRFEKNCTMAACERRCAPSSDFPRYVEAMGGPEELKEWRRSLRIRF